MGWDSVTDLEDSCGKERRVVVRGRVCMAQTFPLSLLVGTLTYMEQAEQLSFRNISCKLKVAAEWLLVEPLIPLEHLPDKFSIQGWMLAIILFFSTQVLEVERSIFQTAKLLRINITSVDNLSVINIFQSRLSEIGYQFVVGIGIRCMGYDFPVACPFLKSYTNRIRECWTNYPSFSCHYPSFWALPHGTQHLKLEDLPLP
ncbi:hypothetical protein VNO78_32971 [Psophocarpus tetragonolobus]|uniref:Uncharacterized protein n=1 Tax=Psophocarpus tetragonolobus TaxID=3891 RepID=A0AAN9NW42_PSOTE